MALSGSFYNYPVSSFGLYCEWSATQSVIGNYSDVTLNVYLNLYTISVGARSDSVISVNGVSETYTTPVINDMSSTNWHRVFLKSKTVRVNHNTNGTKTGVNLSASWRFSGTYSGTYIGTITASQKVDLNSIDRSAPTVSCSTSVISSSSFTINASASATCDMWWYSLNGGSSWTQFSTASGASRSITLTEQTSNVYAVQVRARKASNQVTGTSSSSTVDIVAPTATFTNSNITSTSFYINVSASVTCDRWEYSLNSGSTWIQFSTVSATSVATTISGLSPNGTYGVRVRVRKKSNQLLGMSSTTNITTLGGSLLNSVNTLTVDAVNPVLSLNWTVYSTSFNHTLQIKNGSTTIVTISGLTGSAGTNNKTYTLTGTQRTEILTAMASMASFTATYVLTTFNGSTQIGSAVSKTATITTTSANSKPIFTAFSYFDNNSTTNGVTGNNQILIQGYSSLYITVTAATPKNNATIVRYTATINEKTVNSATGGANINYGTTSSSGSVTLTVNAVDSRGYSTSVSKTVTIINYNAITFNTWSLRRVNEVEAMLQIQFAGTMSPITVSGSPKNSLTYVRYRYKKTTDSSWSSYITISGVTSSSTQFSYTNLSFRELDATVSYDIQLSATDKLSTYTLSLILNKGTPLMAFRSQKVGINNSDPQAALDVIGDIIINGVSLSQLLDIPPL